ncbi:hypothetical protein SMACR_03333 [Sordaria macrospora]|uniref:WGS project CABT00000000 data, contig 2.10 n=2 Tax=Sordaria macrospora TaxID=5147 RepID=F7VWK9_SORMK|nr:uncharacterized protein SMAC_03333 [Sordaria macrospora k-hell]KAA8629046.1 hypothetical protein SMACR_03333 [Sordaria macrospora]KAH7630028.1 hypothetical protein B0T09DRAFT_340842 [Sordaria sp. MPI-SDFR-AT-0083]WPJ66708.1 hypothetical protein SMAC4_03333 [Sordaria macrospora]CCC09777.1 unnamed protein product [Sordaria macrospora k-hell]
MASNESFKVHKFSSKLPEAEAARQRENQRRHRARVKGKIAELENSLADTRERLDAALKHIQEVEAENQRLREGRGSSSVYTSPEPRDESPAEQLLYMSQGGRNGYYYSQPSHQHQFETYQPPPPRQLQHQQYREQHRQPPMVNGLDILASISSSESAVPARHNHRTYHPHEIDCARNLASLPSYEPTPIASPRDMSPIAGLLSMATASSSHTRHAATGFHSPSATTISASPSTESPSRASVFDFNIRGGHFDPSSTLNSQSSFSVETTRTTPDKIGELIECLDNHNEYEDDVAPLPAPRPGESTMPCRDAFSIVRKIQTTRPDYYHDADGLEAESAAREQWRQGFRSETEPGSGCRVQTQLVYDYVDHITGP